MDIQTLLSKKQFQPQQESTLQEFQDYAIQICEKYKIKHPYNKIIFKHAKRNIAYLKAKVGNLEDLPAEKYAQLQKADALGKYLIATMRKVIHN